MSSIGLEVLTMVLGRDQEKANRVLEAATDAAIRDCPESCAGLSRDKVRDIICGALETVSLEVKIGVEGDRIRREIPQHPRSRGETVYPSR